MWLTDWSAEPVIWPAHIIACSRLSPTFCVRLIMTAGYIRLSCLVFWGAARAMASERLSTERLLAPVLPGGPAKCPAGTAFGPVPLFGSRRDLLFSQHAGTVHVRAGSLSAQFPTLPCLLTLAHSAWGESAARGLCVASHRCVASCIPGKTIAFY